MKNTKKKCCTCKEVKDVEDFGKLTSAKDGKHYMCRSCNSKSAMKSHKKHPETKLRAQVAFKERNPGYRRRDNAEQREKYTLPYYVVYCLPNFNNLDDAYVGKTNNTYNRMANHKHLGNNTDEWFVLEQADTNEEALAIEASYHELGYFGGVGDTRKRNKS